MKKEDKASSLLTKASYYSREPHVATLSLKLWPDRWARLGRFCSFNLRKSKVFSFSLSPTFSSSTFYSLPFFPLFLLSHYFHLFPPLQLQASLSSPQPRNGVIGSGGRVKKDSLLPIPPPSDTPPWPSNNPRATWVSLRLWLIQFHFWKAA